MRVCPIFAVDFSAANQNEKRHSPESGQPNEYKELLQAIASGYENILNLPVFGFGAKTSPFLDVASQLFPMSRTIRNPYAPNDAEVLNEVYDECLSQLIHHKPANLTSVFSLLKQVGEAIKKRMQRRAVDYAPVLSTVDSFYVLYVLSSGAIDDAKDLVKFISEPDWSALPV